MGAQVLKALGQMEASAHVKDRIICVPFAPGVVQSEMNRNKAAAPVDEWVKKAAPFILQIPAAENGSSSAMPGYYGSEYMTSWVVPAGARMNDVVRRPSY